jgi:hypothetical protein
MWKWLAVAVLFASSVASAQREVSAPTDESVTATTDRISKISAKFKGSFILFDQSITPDTIAANSQQTQIPSYQWWFSFRPRYYFRPDLSLRVRLDLTTEWLNAVDTTLKREATFGDIWTDLAYNPPKFGGIESTVTLRALWPTSKQTIAQSTIVELGPALSFKRPFPLKKGGEFELSLLLYGLYNFAQYTSSGTASPYVCATTDFNPVSCFQNTGRMNPQFSMTTFLSGKYSPIEQLSINVSYAVLDTWAYTLPDVTVNDKTGGPTQVPIGANNQRLRQSGWFLASIDYDPKDWVELSLGYYCLRSILDPDGSYGNPFFQPGGNARIFLTTTFNLDKVYEAAARRMKRSQSLAAR